MKYLKENGSLPAIASTIVILLVIIIFFATGINREEEHRHVSLIVYGEDSERWENLRQGAELVCEEKNADISLITMMSENDAEEQKDIINRETEDGTDALIIAACNSSKIGSFIKNKKLRIPVVFVETTGSEEDMKCFAPDDYRMGYELGEELVDKESDIVTVSIVSENTERDSVALRKQGLMDAIENKVGRIIIWEKNEDSKNPNTRTFLQKELVSRATDVIVTFDNSTTDALMDALENLNKSSKVYSIATSDKAVYNLYNKRIKALSYTNEFSMGYLAAMYALDRSYSQKRYQDEVIDHRIVRKENMYDEDNQTLLFPFVD